MKTYNLETFVSNKGTIMLPNHMKNLNKHRVMLTLVDLEKPDLETVNILSQITEAYCQINEVDFDIAEIYENREKNDSRAIVFD
jgi:hypothetical protein